MSYKCSLCGKGQPPRVAQLKHTYHRADGSIKSEVPICRSCLNLVRSGVPIEVVIHQNGQAIAVPTTPAQPAPRPVQPIARPVQPIAIRGAVVKVRPSAKPILPPMPTLFDGHA